MCEGILFLNAIVKQTYSLRQETFNIRRGSTVRVCCIEKQKLLEYVSSTRIYHSNCTRTNMLLLFLSYFKKILDCFHFDTGLDIMS